ncbi:reverse transcriptase domain-containing protein, partial [Klebsiella pneumoniae]|uniref:reverse transcriptase domain-containing protein n=1 Tax=Klebsiella pneumoniae TaxID=573 RepID=UPI0040557E69
ANSMIQNVPNAMVYIDDIIIYSNTINEHLNHLENVFKKLKDHALSIQLDKTEFFKNEIPFLGYIVTPEGLKTNPSKIEAITKLPYPNNEKTTRQFLGMTGF